MPTVRLEGLASRHPARHGAIAIAIAVEMTAAVVACSSSSAPHPPALGGCKDRNGVPCTTGLSGGGGGGGGSRQDEGGPADANGSTMTRDSGECVGANSIFGASTAACLACITERCCLNPTSCPNDPNCTAVGACVAQCLPTDPVCVQTCEAPASMATITAFDDLASCSASACRACPSLQTSPGGG